jgi:hypothetical protein
VKASFQLRYPAAYLAGAALFAGAAFFAAPCAAQNHDPAAARLVTEDIPRFWQAFDARTTLGTATAIDSLYFKPGTSGLRDWIGARLTNAQTLAKTVDRAASYYESARASTLQIARDEPRIRAGMLKLKALYPEAVFPDVYFLIGRLSSGGTTGRSGLLIGAEMYGRTTEAALDGLGDWLHQVLGTVDGVPAIVAHELVHYQQRLRDGSLLGRVFNEGSADFVAALMTGDNINRHVHDWVFADSTREAKLWEELQRDIREKKAGEWFSSADLTKRPKDLGYFMGFRFAQAYYASHADKLAAIRDILTTRDIAKLVKESGYQPTGRP